LCVPAGTVHAFLGPNGSGKTTLLKLVSTMLLPDRGNVFVAGYDTKKKAGLVRKQVGFAVSAERSFSPRLTAYENLDFFATFEEVPRRDRAARVSEMLDLVGLTYDAGTMVMKFSSGMYQRLGIARALLKRPAIVLLDEPTRSLDPASISHLRRLIRTLPQSGATALVATHSFQEAACVADKVSILHCGALRVTRPVYGLTAQQLRKSYFEVTGEDDPSSPNAELVEQHELAAG
jgi:ABC-2 type transport system ATP-binding protein